MTATIKSGAVPNVFGTRKITKTRTMTEPIRTMVDAAGVVYLGIKLDTQTTVFISAGEAEHLSQSIRFTLAGLK